MAVARCFASVSGALLSRAAAGQALRLRPASLQPWITAAPAQRQRLAPSGLRTLAAGSQPYWDDDTKSKVNVYADYCIYKGKAAMALKVIKPSWENIGSGLKITREGTVLLEFAPSLATQQYDWQNKQNIALSALECAAVLDAVDTRKGCDFFHDPNKGSAGEGTMTKSLGIKPADKGWFFTLSVNSGGSRNSISCNVSDAELRLIKTLFNFLMPRLLGFDEHFAGAPSVISDHSGSAAAAGGAASTAGEKAPF